MQELRALVSQRSIMSIYIRGETIEIPRHAIGVLLDGFIKTQGSQELVAAPAAIFPSHVHQSYQNLETTGDFKPK